MQMDTNLLHQIRNTEVLPVHLITQVSSSALETLRCDLDTLYQSFEGMFSSISAEATGS